MAGVAARWWVTTATAAYPTVRTPVADATVQSRTPSAIASASGPWPETESPRRRPSRHTTTAAIRLRPRGTAVRCTPSTRTPEPWAVSHPSAPTRSPSRGAPWAPASVRNQPTTPPARQTTSVALAATTPARAASRTSGRRWAASARGSPGRVRRGAGSREVMACSSSPGGRGRSGLPRRARWDRCPHFAGSPRPGVPWSGHVRCRAVRRVLRRRPRPAPRAGVRTHRRPAGLARRGARLLHRHVAPLAQGAPARRSRGVGAPARLVSGTAPAHRAHLAPRPPARPRAEGDARRPGQAARRRPAGAAAHPADRHVAAGDGPRGRSAAGGGGAPAADGDDAVLPAARGADHRRTPPARGAGRPLHEPAVAPRPDHPARRRRAASYPCDRGGRAGDRGPGGERVPGRRRARRAPDAGHRRRPAHGGPHGRSQPARGAADRGRRDPRLAAQPLAGHARRTRTPVAGDRHRPGPDRDAAVPAAGVRRPEGGDLTRPQLLGAPPARGAGHGRRADRGVLREHGRRAAGLRHRDALVRRLPRAADAAAVRTPRAGPRRAGRAVHAPRLATPGGDHGAGGRADRTDHHGDRDPHR